MKRLNRVIVVGAACLYAVQASADPSASLKPYQPDILTLDGQQSYVYTSDNRLSIWDGGTIEFWVAPDWTVAPDYNPVILSNTGDQGTLYEIAIRADKKALTLKSGTMLGEISFDFDDKHMHHVGLVNLGGQVIAMIDGKIAGATALHFVDLTSTELRLGASLGGGAPFHGALAGLRIWDKAIEPETLVKFSWADSTSESSAHPDIAFLAGHSDFTTKDFYIIEKPIIPSGIVGNNGR